MEVLLYLLEDRVDVAHGRRLRFHPGGVLQRVGFQQEVGHPVQRRTHDIEVDIGEEQVVDVRHQVLLIDVLRRADVLDRLLRRYGIGGR